MNRAAVLGEFYTRGREALAMRRVAASIRELQPGRAFPVGDEDFVVLSVMRNAELLVAQFVEHYLALGAARIVVMDNGSRDGTLEILAGHPEVTVIQSRLPFKAYKRQLKLHLVNHYARGRWALFVDADEHFDFPHSSLLGMRGLLAYLNANGFTSVVAYMLDLFADGAFARHAAAPGDDLSKIYRFYDLSEIDEVPYAKRTGGKNRVSLPPISWKVGGVRRAVFGTKFGLTKHPLTRHVDRVTYVPAHRVENAHIADVTGVLRHYKFLSSLREQARLAASELNYARNSEQYRAYLRTLDAEPDLVLKGPTAREFESVEQLVEESFLLVGDGFLEYVEDTRLALVTAAS